MLSIIKDGPLRYLHNAADGALVITLIRTGRRFLDFDTEDETVRTMREWKKIARKRIGDQLITDTDRY